MSDTAPLPYVLGCPSWSELAWRGRLYPESTSGLGFLEHYVRVFNGVEGNTTLYAAPSPETVRRWARVMPPTFHFCAKLPRDISHAEDLYGVFEKAHSFIALLAPLGTRLSPLWLQLPARFGAARLPELLGLLDALMPLNIPMAVEVRHPVFFAKGDEERRLNRALLARAVERICLDSRALFHCRLLSPAVQHAQARKPRLPVRPTAFTQYPQVRFIGHPDLEANDLFLAPWLDKVAHWIEEGRTPHVYLHTPDNRQAPELAGRFHKQLQMRLPGLPALVWPTNSAPRQGDLF